MKKTILLVDDNWYVLQGLLISLRMCAKDCVILLAGQGKEALDIVNSVPVDFILTDLSMPVMDGFELLAYLKKSHPHIPAIAMTSGLTPESSEKLHALGVARCVEKPFNFEVLAQVIFDEFELLSGKEHA